ncbi:PREDICTED: uncharacterized protein LOC103328826 [Prunus mume]|uniref:Uncharacterized protein LOC103328826 n=1 Tax=Prunus mume TaxID=102107 RepID=A0ABM0NT60_PRUMU|nr:PREDICTED: uncharacterized protein LOC103328826 [Prunus mume]
MTKMPRKEELKLMKSKRSQHRQKIHHRIQILKKRWNSLKPYRGGVKKILGDVKPFTEAESYFADAKFYMDEDMVYEVIPVEVHLTRKAMPRREEHSKCLSAEEKGLKKSKSTSSGQMGSSPTDSRKVGYDFSLSSSLGELNPDVTEERTHGLSETQKMLKEQGYTIDSARAGLGFTPVVPVKISVRRKEKKAEAQHISVEAVKEEEQPKAVKRASVFDRLAKPTKRISVFSRIKESTSRPSVFKRIFGHKTQRRIQPASHRSALERIGALSKSSEEKSQRELESGKTLSHQNENDNEEAEILDVHHVTIKQLDEEEPFKDEVHDAPAALEDGGQATVDELKELNLGTNENPRPIFVSALLNPSEEESYYKLLLEYKDVFAWTYKEMPGLNPKVAVHHLAVKRGTHPIKQTQRRFHPELLSQIKAEVNKLIAAGFIREVKYPTWIANIVPVKKKITGQIRICVDFRDLNEACPKNDFPLPIIELMVDATTSHETLSFMDGSSGYNQIRMSPEDEVLTAFCNPKGIYCYKVMSFGLKNAGATYQCAMQKIFGDMLHKNVECYVDDLVIKSKRREDLLKDLRMVFNRLRTYQLKMNPWKCAFGVTLGKFLGFIIKYRGIEVDQTKIKTIRDMPEPRNLREMKSLQGHLAFIWQFISNLGGRCQPFSRLMKKDVPFVWDEAYHNAFESIKKYLSSSPLLGAPIPGKPLILYIAAQERSIGALLMQENESHKEQALYYLSRTLTGPELKYTLIEKTCLALNFAIQKLRHYMQAFTVYLIARADPIRYVMSKPVLTGRLAKWALLINQYEIIYAPAKAVKGQVVADFLADHPIPADWEISDDLLDEQVFFADVSPAWMMFFDGSARKDEAGASIVFISPKRHVLPYSFSLSEFCSNNVAEYQALIMGLQMVVEMKISSLEVYGDSMLVINQLLTHYEVRMDDLIPYHQMTTQLLERFDFVTLEHVPRKDKKMAGVLANLAATLALTKDKAVNLPVCKRWVIPLTLGALQEGVNVISVLSIDIDDWRQPLIDYLKHGKLQDDSRHQSEAWRRAPRFIYYKEILYRRSFEGLFLRCLGEEDASKAMEQVHSGICGAHQSGPKLHFQIKRMSYYWPTMVKDCMDYVKKYQACQFHANFIHQPPEPLHPTITSWPFDAWGLDVMGPIAPKSSDGHSYIIAATNYFSKWAEAVPLKEVKKENAVSFIKVNIIHRYGVPRYIITDNGKPFSNRLMDKLCEDFGFKQCNSSMFNAPANGLAEAFNQTLCNLLKKVVRRTKKDWHERINEALWVYRTTYQMPTQATPYSLVYGVEAILPLESQIPSLRMVV